MTASDSQPPPPSPCAFLGAIFYGATMGFVPGLFILIVVQTGLASALGISALIIILAVVQQVIGWTLVMAPVYSVRWLWRRVNGQAPTPGAAPEPRPAETTYWMLKAGFASGMALMVLMFLRGTLAASELAA